MPNKFIKPRILMSLKQGPLETWQIVVRVGCSRSSMVHALKQLVDDGLVEKRDQFRFAVYAITQKGLESCTK